MSIIESKRRGRPARARDEDEAVEIVEADPAGDEAPVIKLDGPPCLSCGRPTQRSTKLLRRYELVAVKCDFCRQVSIENDGRAWDTLTASTGNPPPIVVRAMTIYEGRHNAKPPTPAGRDGMTDAIRSDWDDPRWTEIEY